MAHRERHAISRVGWLRAVVLGANDGLLSTSSLIIGVATAHGSRASILIAGLSGLLAGALSMAAGEYVSVSSQADSEAADVERERQELIRSPAAEHNELVEIYIQRGVSRDLAEQVATQLMARDALAAHARDELGISEQTAARPIQAAFASAGSFSIGAILPLLAAALSPSAFIAPAVAILSVPLLAVLGAAGAKTGGAKIVRGTFRVVVWGIIAMAVTAAIGRVAG